MTRQNLRLIKTAANETAFASLKPGINFTLRLLPILILTCSAQAQPNFEACAAITTDASRLACFDRAISASQEPEAQQTTPSARPEPSGSNPVNTRIEPRIPATEPKQTQAIAAGSAEDDFGMELKKTNSPEAESRHVTVINSRHNKLTGWTIELTNGQTWKQVGTKDYSISNGKDYKITRASFNSFFLSNDANNRRMRITRVE